MKKQKTVNIRTSKDKYLDVKPELTVTCIMCGKPALKKKGEPNLCFGHWMQHTCPNTI